MMRRKTTSFSWKKLFLFFKERAFVLILILCAISAICLSGIYMLEQSKEKDEINLVDLDNAIDEYEESALLEEEEETEITEVAEAAGSNVTEENYGEGDQGENYQDVVESITEGTDESFGNAELVETEEVQEADTMDVAEAEDTSSSTEAKVPASSKSVNLNYSEADLLSWPVAGNVLLDYSMDKSIFFPTLEQYKYNPALIIQSQVNTQVLAAATGKVLSIDTNEETGTTIVMDLGNKYELKYGQLKEVAVGVGDTVKEGEIIGYINEPTKYYTVEGSNLYLQMTKAGTPIDPMDLLE